MLVGEKVVLAPTGPEDLRELWEMRNLPNIVGFMDDELDFHGQAQAIGVDPFVLYQQHVMNEINRGMWYFSIWNKHPVKLVGTMYSTMVYRDGTVVPTILLAREFWGKGYAEDVADVMFKWAFRDQFRNGLEGYKMVMTYIHKGNRASIAYVERVGMTKEGIHPKADEENNQVIYQLRKHDWLALKQDKNEKPAKKKRGRPKKEEVEA